MTPLPQTLPMHRTGRCHLCRAHLWPQPRRYRSSWQASILLLLLLVVPLRAEAGPPLGWFSAVTSKDPGPCADAAIRVMLGFGMTVKENAQFTKMTLVSAENREVNLVVICSPKEGGSRITVVVASASTPARAGEYAETIVDRVR